MSSQHHDSAYSHCIRGTQKVTAQHEASECSTRATVLRRAVIASVRRLCDTVAINASACNSQVMSGACHGGLADLRRAQDARHVG